MHAENNIPIVIGVTGHRAIRPEDREALFTAIKTELAKLEALCPNSPLLMLSSLAEGGDLLCADAAEELGISLIAALPMERKIYELDFSEEALLRFAHHCARAEQVFVAPATEAIPEVGPNQDFGYRQAGIYVAAHCHVLLALWDGGPGTAAACGTAETVDFALRGSYFPARGVSLRSDSNEAVLHVFTPRGKRTEEAAGTVHALGNWENLREILARTDSFNALAAEQQTQGTDLLPADHADDPLLVRMEQIYQAASAISGAAAKKYRQVLAGLAIASMLLTMAFLLYDEAEAHWMILLCGAILLAAWGCRRFAVRSDCHRLYLECRALAESLRVQAYLRYAGSGIQAADHLSWTQQEETAWIMDALCVLVIGQAPTQSHDIRECWAEGQRKYHQWACGRALQNYQVSERVVQTALGLSIVLYLAAVVYELLCGGLFFPSRLFVSDVEIYRTLLKLLLGSISAITLFISNYYGRLSLPRQLSDHRKMERFYRKMYEQLELHGQTDALLAVLAREELIENGNWHSYQRDNTPDISL